MQIRNVTSQGDYTLKIALVSQKSPMRGTLFLVLLAGVSSATDIDASMTMELAAANHGFDELEKFVELASAPNAAAATALEAIEATEKGQQRDPTTGKL